jgi:hypothetical protein
MSQQLYIFNIFDRKYSKLNTKTILAEQLEDFFEIGLKAFSNEMAP